MQRKKRTAETAESFPDLPVETVAVSANLSAGKRDMLLLLVLVVTAFAVRVYSLRFFPVISTDGTSYVGAARALGMGDPTGLGVSGFYPVLIWVASMFTPDYEAAGRYVSVLMGSLLVVPLYFLGRELYSRKVAIAACLLAIVWPQLVSFSCEVMTQATNVTLVTAGLYLVWRASVRPSLPGGCLAGFCIGLAYLTRPEGLLLFFLLPLALILYRDRELRAEWPLALSYAGGFLLLFGINLVLVHQVTGEWQISAKTDSALNDALSYYLNKPDLGYVPGYEPKGYLDILRDHPEFIVKNSILNIIAVWKTILPAPLWLFAAAGFVAGGFSRERNMARLFLCSSLASLAVIVVFYYISYGYVEVYLPVLFLWVASGVVWLEEKVATRFHIGRYGEWLLSPPCLTLAAAAIYAVTLFLPQIRTVVTDAEYLPAMDNGRRDEKHIGLILRESLPPGKIMTRWARVAFYAERDWVSIPAGVDLDSIIKVARDNGASFLIADGMLYSMRPQLGLEIFAPLRDEDLPYGKLFMIDPDFRVKGLRPFMLYTDPRSAGVVVYEIPPAS